MINCIIVDDEPLALDVLETHIENFPDVKLVHKCLNAIEADEILRTLKVDLMFLDIQMPQINGIDFLKSLENPPITVFTTAFSEYAVEGYDLNVVDYLLKPISLERFMKTIHKVRERMQRIDNNKADEKFIFVKADKKLIKVNYDDIIYIEGLKDYVIIRNEIGRIITLQTMKSLDNKLPTEQFQRIHRSYIINMDKIKAVIGNMVEVIENGKPKHIPIGKNYRENLLDLINQMRL